MHTLCKKLKNFKCPNLYRISPNWTVLQFFDIYKNYRHQKSPKMFSSDYIRRSYEHLKLVGTFEHSFYTVVLNY